jgi:decaprenylphospho-beta-D-ribofuranose 2-oxidase
MRPDLRFGQTFALCLLLLPITFGQAQVVANDVSGLNPTDVQSVIRVRNTDQIRSALSFAAAHHLKVSIAGKRHSQGGHTAAPNGIVLDMPGFNRIVRLDPVKKVITVESGATWKQIQDYVNSFGLAVAVQQSSNIFTVGGSMGVNAHGRDPRFGPVITTVNAFRLMNADGRVVNVSRTENSELFSLVIGGYGLFGVILDVDLQLVDDAVYQKRCERMNYREYPAFFEARVKDKANVGLHYARPSIARLNHLKTMIACTFTETHDGAKNIHDLQEEGHITRNRRMLAMSRRSQAGKNIRWFLQETFAENPRVHVISRNNAMRPEVAFLEYQSKADTDVLQEYFIPADQFVTFMDRHREILGRHKVNLLNETVRYVPKDDQAFLRYAKADGFAFVLYINHSRSKAGMENIARATRDLIDAALAVGGTYYLPYQTYATQSKCGALILNSTHLFKPSEGTTRRSFSAAPFFNTLAPNRSCPREC